MVKGFCLVLALGVIAFAVGFLTTEPVASAQGNSFWSSNMDDVQPAGGSSCGSTVTQIATSSCDVPTLGTALANLFIDNNEVDVSISTTTQGCLRTATLTILTTGLCDSATWTRTELYLDPVCDCDRMVSVLQASLASVC